MRFNLKKEVSAFLIGVLVVMSGAPHLTAAASDRKSQEEDGGDVLIGSNGTRYDFDYDPYIRDEEVQYYDEDSEEYEDFIRNYYGTDRSFASAAGGQISLASASNLASPSNLASASNAELSLETVVFTNAGPFLPPVSMEFSGSEIRAKAGTAALAEINENGVILNKTAMDDPNKPGEYSIRLEAYTTGRRTATETISPVDIVLVLDQSMSMAWDFEGNKTDVNTDRRQYAMKQAVNNFIETVGEEYNAASSDHRMAIVTFGSGAEILADWTFVNADGEDILHEKINSLEDLPAGVTDIAAGMNRAEDLMGTNYHYTGGHPTRQKVVIVFTDGVPTKQNNFDPSIAAKAIQSAKRVKDKGTAVYSIGIFNGANPDELYGDSWKRFWLPDIPCTGETGSLWGGFWAASLAGKNDFEAMDIPAGNRFLNYLSTNSKDTETIGIDKGEKKPEIGFSGMGYEITENYDCENNGYYLTADNAFHLDDIFTSISQNISSAGVNLGMETMVEDILSPYFEISDEEKIAVKTADYEGNGCFGNDVRLELKAALVREDGKKIVSVKGFNFDENYVTELPREINGNITRGKKLIIEFNVKPREGFLGGNRVPTNDSKSGVYGREDGKKRLVEKFEIPTVDVPIPEIEVIAASKNIYLMGTLTDSDYQSGATVKCGNYIILGEGKDQLEDWQRAYVNIPALSELQVESLFGDLTEDGTYRLSCKISPKEEGIQEEKTAVSEPGAIYVYRPVITCHDGEIFYGEKISDEYNYDACMQDDEGNNAIAWKHEEKEKTEDAVMSGTEPELSFTYEYDFSKTADGKVNTKDTLPIKVTAVKAGTREENIKDLVEWKHADCNGISSNEMSVYPGYHFLLHVETGSLTIEKIVEDGMGEGEFFVFTITKDGEPYVTCAVQGNDKIKVANLPQGKYKIMEETGKGTLAWRYGTPEYSEKELNLDKDNKDISFVCTNKIMNQKWLSGSTKAINKKAPERNSNMPKTTGFFNRNGITGEKRELFGNLEDQEANLYGKGMRKREAGGDL